MKILTKPCKRGHQGIRYSGSRTCVECKSLREKTLSIRRWVSKLTPEELEIAMRVLGEARA